MTMHLNTVKKHIILILGETRWWSLPDEERQTIITELFRPGDLLHTNLQELISEGLVKHVTIKEVDTFYELTDRGMIFHRIMTNTTGLTMPYSEIAYKTVLSEDLRDYTGFVETFFENWSGEFVHVIADWVFYNNETNNSLYFCFIATQTASFDWLSHSLFNGAYDVVLRELRSILEGLILSYSIDLKDPDQDIKTKLNTLHVLEQNGSSHGKKVFKASQLDDWENYYLLYKDLCAYVHTSRKIVGEKISDFDDGNFPDMLDPTFDKDLFIKCVQVWREIAKLATILCDNLFDIYKIESRILPEIFELHRIYRKE